MQTEESPEAGEVVYREAHRFGAWLPLLIVLEVILMLGLLLVGIAMGLWYLIVFPCLVFVLFIAAYLNLRVLLFEVTGTEVRFGFGLIRKRFPVSAILSCEPYELQFKNYLGYGVRYGRDGTVAYNTRSGPGIKMVVEGQKKPYVVSLDDPGAACRLLSPAGRSPDRQV